MSAAASRRPSKLLDQINFPFAASLVLNDDHAEVFLYIFLGSSTSMPQAALNITLRYPYQPLLSDSKKPRFKIASPAGPADLATSEHHQRFLLEHLDLAAIQLADAHSQVPRAQADQVLEATTTAPVEFLTLASSARFMRSDDEVAAGALLEEANAGVALHAPKLVAEGEGGTYFVYDTTGATVGVFKPNDEDPQADNNPKRKNSLGGAEEERTKDEQRTRQSIPANETAVREAAAYAIDRGYAGVPPTFLVEARHPSFRGNGDEAKLGSLQQFATNECASWDVGPASFSVADVHRIGMFDIRTFNTDRHGGNLLCRKAAQPSGKVQYDLVPIDHAYCFPTALGEANWEWLYWPQAKVPFSEEELRYIDGIDVEADAALLARLGLSPEAVRVYRITTTFLKRGAAAGLTLFELGKLCYRGRNDTVSQLETICATLDLLDDGDCGARFDDRVSSALEHLCQTHRPIVNNNNNNNLRTQVSRG